MFKLLNPPLWREHSRRLSVYFTVLATALLNLLVLVYSAINRVIYISKVIS